MTEEKKDLNVSVNYRLTIHHQTNVTMKMAYQIIYFSRARKELMSTFKAQVRPY